jgi:hypothetical protein
MDENKLEKAEKLINSLANLAEKLDTFPFALELIYLIFAALFCAFAYLMTRMIIEYRKESKMTRLLEENNRIIGACDAVMQNVCRKLEEL